LVKEKKKPKQKRSRKKISKEGLVVLAKEGFSPESQGVERKEMVNG